MQTRLALAAALAAVALLAGCTGGDAPDTIDAPESLTVTSSAWETSGTIPTRFTCDGEDVSPPLEVEDVPDGTATLALLVSDPDAPDGTFDHWAAWNRDPAATSIPENASRSGFDGVEGTNDFGDRGWRGPCPPEDEEHRYVFRFYAVEETLDLEGDADGTDLREALKGKVKAQGALVGIYGR